MKFFVGFEPTNQRCSAFLAWGILIAVLGTSIKAIQPPISDVSNITRLEDGDTFSFKGAECIKRECGGRGETLSCFCGCPAHAPLFREDRGECVDDISECSVAPFGSGSSAQRVPYVFLPLKGQIIHPSKEISFPGVRTPICAVSGAQFLTRNGFVDLRNTLDADVPFALFRDEGRTFLQWTGETEMRSRMEGRLLVVHLLCRDVGTGVASGGPRGLHGVFTPCAAFRVAGSPAKHITNVSEVLFSPDARSSDDTTAPGLTLTEYIAIGVSSVLLGLIYVASIFLYLHIKKRRSKNEICVESATKSPNKSKRNSANLKEEQQSERHPHNIEADEDGIIKNNPLLGIDRHFHGRNDENDDFETDSGSHSGAEDAQEELHDDNLKDPSNPQATLTVHPVIHHDQNKKNFHRANQNEMMLMRDDSGNERLPEENVSIIETLDMRDEKPETVRAIGTTRRKLYFNPSYFEPHLLLSPPPAAIEFLVKIREVISIAKHKMATKRFNPSLIGIPEEETCYSFDNNFYQIGSQRSSIVSLKRENNRRRPHCSGCPGCEAMDMDMHELSAYIPDIRGLGACHSCSLANGVNKQTSIRKWLEGVPILKSSNNGIHNHSEARMLPDVSSSGNGLLNSLLSLPKEKEPPRKYYDFTSRSLYGEDTDNFIFKKRTSSVKSEPSFNKFSIPLPSFSNVSPRRFEHERTIAKISDISPIGLKSSERKFMSQNDIDHYDQKAAMKHALPDMINEAMAVDKNRNSSEKSTASNGYILDERKEAKKHKAPKKIFNSLIEMEKHGLDYETDSLERNPPNKGFSTPTEYGEVSSSQPSPSLSTALPMDEEMTMRNAIYKLNSGSRPSSRVSMKENSPKSSGDYEIIEKNISDHILNGFDNHIYTMPEMPPNRAGDYSLVTEVYVNNGYNFGSTPTSPSESDCSTFGRRKAMIKGPDELPGHLTIEVKDPPENYIQIHESDGFEPDTLDRKPNKIKINVGVSITERNFVLGVLPENNINEVKSPGIFKSSSLTHANMATDEDPSRKDFTSLREIYESKSNNKKNQNFLPAKAVDSRDYEIIENVVIDSDEGRLLTLESRHSKRQRQSTPPSLKGAKPIPPDVVPPTPPEELMSIYEYPKPPRKVIKENMVPPLPPKNESGRSPSSRKTKCNNGLTANLDADNKISHSELSSGLERSPSGASVRSLPSSDYENIADSQGDKVSENIQPDPKSIKQATQSKTPSKINFREHQTPKANRKLRSNASARKSFRNKKDGDGIKKVWRRAVGNQYKEDSGYLSTDSNESRRITRRKQKEARLSGSDTDESVEDARSESGAESVETHSVFFGSLRKVSLIAGSVDSGNGSDLRISEVSVSELHDELEYCQRDDYEKMNFEAVTPFDSAISSNSVTRVNC